MFRDAPDSLQECNAFHTKPSPGSEGPYAAQRVPHQMQYCLIEPRVNISSWLQRSMPCPQCLNLLFVEKNLPNAQPRRFLSLPKSALDASFNALRHQRTAEVEEALQYLLAGEGKSDDVNEEDLVDWYTNEARIHFATHVRFRLTELWRKVQSGEKDAYSRASG
jgi:hypothetical protein